MAASTATAEPPTRDRPRRPRSVRRAVPAFVWLWIATRVLLLVVSLNPRLYSTDLYGDVRAYGAKAERIFQGELPYRDVAIEYPPGSVPFTLVPGLAARPGGRPRPAAYPAGLHPRHAGRRPAAVAALRPGAGGVRAAGGRAGRGGPSRAVGGGAGVWRGGQAVPRCARAAAGARAGAHPGLAPLAQAHRAAVPARLRSHRRARTGRLGHGHARLTPLPRAARRADREPARQPDRPGAPRPRPAGPLRPRFRRLRPGLERLRDDEARVDGGDHGSAGRRRLAGVLAFVAVGRARAGRLGGGLRDRRVRLRPSHPRALAAVHGVAGRTGRRAGRPPAGPRRPVGPGRRGGAEPARVPLPLLPASPPRLDRRRRAHLSQHAAGPGMRAGGADLRRRRRRPARRRTESALRQRQRVGTTRSGCRGQVGNFDHGWANITDHPWVSRWGGACREPAVLVAHRGGLLLPSAGFTLLLLWPEGARGPSQSRGGDMRHYEVMVIFDPSLEDKDVKAAVDRHLTTVTSRGGKVVKF